MPPSEPTSEPAHHYAGVFLVVANRLVGQRRDDIPGIDNPGKVGSFGGTVEEGEPWRQAAWRELTQEETNLSLTPADLEHYLDDVAWRALTKEWEARHFYYARVSENSLAKLEVYEGQGWAEIRSAGDHDLIDLWREPVDQLLKRLDEAAG